MWSVHQTAMDEVPGSRLSWNDLGTVAAGGSRNKADRWAASLSWAPSSLNGGIATRFFCESDTDFNYVVGRSSTRPTVRRRPGHGGDRRDPLREWNVCSVRWFCLVCEIVNEAIKAGELVAGNDREHKAERDGTAIRNHEI